MKKADLKLFIIQKITDIVCVLLSWFAAYLIRFELSSGQQGLKFLFIKLGLLLAILNLFPFGQKKLYQFQRFRQNYVEIFLVCKTNTLAIISFVIILYFFAENRVSRATILLHYIFSTFMLIQTRILIKSYLHSLRKKGKNLYRTLLIGSGPQLEKYIESVKDFKDSGIALVGRMDCPKTPLTSDIPEVKESYKDFIKNNPIDMVIVGYSGSKSTCIDLFLRENYNDLIPLQILPDLSFSLIGYQIEDFSGIPLISINLPSYGPFEIIIKRMIDIFTSVIGLIILSPILLVIGLAVKISSKGPVFYGQNRLGLDGKEFTMWKFRTMTVPKGNEDQNTWSSKDNFRKTLLGALLRKKSLDELPQLWNVLCGNMSLVGPRPERPYFVNQFRNTIPHYMLRHKMKAGITGLAQINGLRGDTSIKKRIEYDLHYIKHWSLWLDLKIMFLTLLKGLFNKNAY